MKSHASRSTILAFTLLATTGVARADDVAQDDGAAAEGDAATEGDAAMPEPPADASADASAATSRWPRANIARPLTLPKGLANLGATVSGLAGFDIFALGLNAGYGVSDDLELRLGYTLSLDPGEAKGPLGFQAGYKLLRGAAGGKLEVIARAGTGYDFLLEGLTPLVAGAQVQYNVSDKLALFTSGNHLNIALEEVSVTVGGVTATSRPVFLSLPVGAGYQITPELWAQLETNLANIEISDSDTAVLFADFVPLTASIIYNVMPELDITAAFGFADLSNEAGDNVFFSIGAQYYLGEL